MSNNSDTYKDTDSKILNEIKELNDKVECTQKSLALLYQILPEKIREAIIDGLNERNLRSWPI